jgi:hypothetical protein
MRFREITESTSSLLYHMMGYDKTLAVLKSDELEGRWESEIPGLGRFTGTSMTRSRHKILGRCIRLVVNRSRLQQKHRIIPVDGDIVFRHTGGYSSSGVSSRSQNSYGSDHAWSEEFVVGSVKPLHDYLARIDLLYPNPMDQQERLPAANAIEMRDVCLEYGKRFSIPINVTAPYAAFIAKEEKRWADEEAEEYDD